MKTMPDRVAYVGLTETQLNFIWRQLRNAPFCEHRDEVMDLLCTAQQHLDQRVPVMGGKA